MRTTYVAPSMEIIPVEGTMACLTGSGATTATDYGTGHTFSRMGSYGNSMNSTASGSDLDDMINDILTVGQ